MKIIYISNFMNHHVKAIADELFLILGNNFLFVETKQVKSEESLKGSRSSDFLNLPYLYSLHNESYNIMSEDKLYSLLKECDVVIQGDANDKYIKDSLKKNRLIFRISEHILKGSKWDFLRTMKYFIRNYKLRNKNSFLLCASSHAAMDMKKSKSFIGKSFKWGYFPTVFDDGFPDFSGKISTILWAGRMIDWKHPEYILYTAEILRSEHISAVINVVGDGPLLNNIKREIELAGLKEYVTFKGKLTANEVQYEMKTSDIFIFTSDIAEGWGAVLNESMGNACIPIANMLAGSTNYLIEDNINGFVYDGSLESFTQVIKTALDLSGDRISDIKKMAYETVKYDWNAQIAVQRLIEFIKDENRDDWQNKYFKGPMSKAD